MSKLSPEDRAYLDLLWKRYHNGGIDKLPPQVYFDFGWMFGLLAKLAERDGTNDW